MQTLARIAATIFLATENLPSAFGAEPEPITTEVTGVHLVQQNKSSQAITKFVDKFPDAKLRFKIQDFHDDYTGNSTFSLQPTEWFSLSDLVQEQKTLTVSNLIFQIELSYTNTDATSLLFIQRNLADGTLLRIFNIDQTVSCFLYPTFPLEVGSTQRILNLDLGLPNTPDLTGLVVDRSLNFITTYGDTNYHTNCKPEQLQNLNQAGLLQLGLFTINEELTKLHELLGLTTTPICRNVIIANSETESGAVHPHTPQAIIVHSPSVINIANLKLLVPHEFAHLFHLQFNQFFNDKKYHEIYINAPTGSLEPLNESNFIGAGHGHIQHHSCELLASSFNILVIPDAEFSFNLAKLPSDSRKVLGQVAIALLEDFTSWAKSDHTIRPPLDAPIFELLKRRVIEINTK